MKVKVWEWIRFQNNHFKIIHHNNIHHWQITIKVAYVFTFAMN
jgi:hypothetical protein